MVSEAPQQVIVSSKIIGAAGIGPIGFDISNLPANSRDDRFGDLVLDLKNLVEWAIVFLRPDMISTTCIDQLRIDPNPVLCASNTAFDQVLYRQLLGNFINIERRTAKLERGMSSNHLNVGKSG